MILKLLLNSKSNVVKMNEKQWPSMYQANFLTPGVVSYQDVGQGVALLKKEAIDKMLPSFVGKPVIIDHQDITEKDFQKVAVGYITDVFYNVEDGWYYCKFLITKDEGHKEIANGMSVSCAFDVLETKGGGEYLAVKYNEEILDGKGTHLALVKTPRYEDAKVTMLNAKAVKKSQGMRLVCINQKGGGMKGLVVKIGEELIPLENILQKTNSKVAPMEIASDQEIEMEDGSKVKVADLVTKYNEVKEKEVENAAKMCSSCGEPVHEGACNEEKKKSWEDKKKNEAEDLEKKNAEEGEEKEKKENEDEELKKKEEEEKKNAEEKEKKDAEEKEKEELKIKEQKKNAAHFVKLNSLKNANGHFEVGGMVDTLQDRVSRGADRYTLKK